MFQNVGVSAMVGIKTNISQCRKFKNQFGSFPQLKLRPDVLQKIVSHTQISVTT